jgi:hypothetical protein
MIVPERISVGTRYSTRFRSEVDRFPNWHGRPLSCIEEAHYDMATRRACSHWYMMLRLPEASEVMAGLKPA